MNKSESKYFNTAVRMDEAFLQLLEDKEFEYITVKEICEKAGVNRSTFYLHYESINDLLDESLEYMNRQFVKYFDNDNENRLNNIDAKDLHDLYFITPKYLKPYLEYVKSHRRLFRAALEKSVTLRTQNSFNRLFKYVFDPIMERYSIPDRKRPYIITFYIKGMIGTIEMWLNNDCEDSIDFMTEVIIECLENSKHDII